MMKKNGTIERYIRTGDGRQLVAQTNYDLLFQSGAPDEIAEEIRTMQAALDAVETRCQQSQSGPDKPQDAPRIARYKRTSNDPA